MTLFKLLICCIMSASDRGTQQGITQEEDQMRPSSGCDH